MQFNTVLFRQRGFSLFTVFVLIVGLLGVVTFYVSGKGTNIGNITNYSDAARASSIIAQAGAIQGGFNVLTTAGVPLSQVTFDASDSASVFSASGGGVQKQIPDPSAFTTVGGARGFWIYRGAAIKVGKIGTGAPGYMVLASGLKANVCSQINRQLLNVAGPIPSLLTAAAWRKADVTAAAPVDVATPVVDLSGNATFDGISRACFSTTDGEMIFVRIVAPQ